MGLTLLLVLVVRVRLRDMPLERDEGEYAYAGQLILHGVPPYQEAFNMKLPGTYAAYALIMAVFGQSASGIHLGLALVNAASVFLIFLIGRELLDNVAGVAAAIAYALLSLSPSVLGLAAHATHFVVLPALAGLWCLLRAMERRRNGLIFAGGALLGFAFLMKQHGLFFALFGGAMVLWFRTGGELPKLFSRQPKRQRHRWERAEVSSESNDGFSWSSLAKELGMYAGGVALPYLLTCLVLALAGVFPQFWFWTVSYAREYASAIPWIKGEELMRTTSRAVIGPNVVFWLLCCAGAIFMWWEERLEARRRMLLVALLLCSLASVSVGFYYREHYFILLLPAVSLLAAVAVSRSIHLLRRDRSVELFLALAVVVAFPVAVGAAVIGNGAVWFTLSPREAVENIYLTTVFSDARELGESLKTTAAPDARIAVIGSEPEIYFYANRRGATGYIYTYPLMERHPYAAKMQAEMMRAIETNRPQYVVFVQNPLSWLAQENSERALLDWWPKYWATNLDLVKTVNTKQGVDAFLAERDSDKAAKADRSNHLLLLKRKDVP